MQIGLHNAYSQIDGCLRNMQALDFRPESGGAGEAGANAGASVASTSYSKPSLSERRRAEYNRVVERFIYLAVTGNRHAIKVGLSESPEKRLRCLNGHCKVLLFPSHKPGGERFDLSLARVWSLGVIRRQDALRLEGQIHAELRPLAHGHHGEFYRLAASIAAALIDRHVTSFRRSA